jgi:type II secretory pathway pseudopilin PulG
MFKKSFTLAEILVVIGIIGVIASLTIPNLSNKSDNEQAVIKLKQSKNEINTAVQQAFAKYGEYNYWYTDANGFDEADVKGRIMDFLEVTNSTATFPYSAYNTNSNYTKYELKNGTYYAVKASDGSLEIIVALGGPNGNVLGKDIFGFKVNLRSGVVDPFGKDSDVGTSNAFSVSNNINATNWAIVNDNLDYLKCASNLNWANKRSCN